MSPHIEIAPRGTPSAAQALGSYRRLINAVGQGTTAGASGTKYHLVANQLDRATTAPGANGSGITMLQVVSAELAVAGLTTKLLVHSQISTTTAAPAVTITVGLYPLTVSANFVLGTVVSGSTVATVTPAANSIVDGNSTDFTLPANGSYVLGYVVDGTPSGNFTVTASVSVRNV